MVGHGRILYGNHPICVMGVSYPGEMGRMYVRVVACLLPHMYSNGKDCVGCYCAVYSLSTTVTGP
jgi:hypothetical protein